MVNFARAKNVTSRWGIVAEADGVSQREEIKRNQTIHGKLFAYAI